MITELINLGFAINPRGAPEQRVACPKCEKGRRDTALGVNIMTGAFHCFRCDWKGRAADDSISNAYIPPARAQISSGPLDWSSLAQSIWDHSIDLRGTIGETYLQGRGCALPPQDSDLRFLKGDDRYPPSLCGRITDATTAAPLSLHFTRLAADGSGKAGTDADKRMLKGHRKAGGVIRLWPHDAVTYGLALAEGLESALAAAQAYRPVWAAIDAGNLAAFPVLAGIQSLVVFADHDSAGIKAANAVAHRWKSGGRSVRVVMPPDQGADAADLVVA